MQDIFISSCKLFRATLASKKGRKKHIEYKIVRRATEEAVGFVYQLPKKNRSQWVFDPLLCPFTPTELMDLATLVSTIRLTITGEEENL
jgi:hypothetical protein